MFEFNLQTLLDHRQYLEDSLQKEVAQYLKTLSGEKVRLKALERHGEKTREALREGQAGPGAMTLIPIYHDYLDRNKREINQQYKRVAKAKADYEAKIQELVDARKKRETLEKLKERQQAAYIEKIKAQDQSLMNEVAVIGHVRRGRQKAD